MHKQVEEISVDELDRLLRKRKGPPSSPEFPHVKGTLSEQQSLTASISLCGSSQIVLSPPSMTQSNTLHVALRDLQEINRRLESQLSSAKEQIG